VTKCPGVQGLFSFYQRWNHTVVSTAGNDYSMVIRCFTGKLVARNAIFLEHTVRSVKTSISSVNKVYHRIGMHSVRMRPTFSSHGLDLEMGGG